MLFAEGEMIKNAMCYNKTKISFWKDIKINMKRRKMFTKAFFPRVI